MDKKELVVPKRTHIDINDDLIEFITGKTEAMINAVKKAPILSFLVDKSHPSFAWVNEAVVQVLGYSEEEICSMNFLDLVHPDDKELTQYAFETQKMFDVNHWAFRNRYRKKDGNYVTLVWASVDLEFGDFMISQAIWLEGFNEFNTKWTIQG